MDNGTATAERVVAAFPKTRWASDVDATSRRYSSC